MTEQTVRIFALISACNARVAGMTAENMQRQQLGHSMAFDEQSFAYEASELERLACEVVQQ